MTMPAEFDLSVLPPEIRAAFEDLETAGAAAEEAKNRASATPSASRPARTGVKRNQGRLPEELPRIDRVIEPASTLCLCGCGQMARIGADRVERLDIIPAQFFARAGIELNRSTPADWVGKAAFHFAPPPASVRLKPPTVRSRRLTPTAARPSRARANR